MLIKKNNFYINEKNIVTLRPFVATTSYGLEINGVNYKMGEIQPDKELQKAKLSAMKGLCTTIIKKLEKNND